MCCTYPERSIGAISSPRFGVSPRFRSPQTTDRSGQKSARALIKPNKVAGTRGEKWTSVIEICVKRQMKLRETKEKLLSSLVEAAIDGDQLKRCRLSENEMLVSFSGPRTGEETAKCSHGKR